jgi:hypothetical protein
MVNSHDYGVHELRSTSIMQQRNSDLASREMSLYMYGKPGIASHEYWRVHMIEWESVRLVRLEKDTVERYVPRQIAQIVGGALTPAGG